MLRGGVRLTPVEDFEPLPACLVFETGLLGLLGRWVPYALDLARADGALASCSASTTATNSQKWDSGRV